MKDRILLGMSGGTDSNYCAKRLLSDGYDVVGIHFDFCTDEGNKEAEAAAKKLGIEFYNIDKRADFEKKVIIPFVEEYKCGRTPNPCSLCNPNMKFASLIEAADELNCRYIATGHYAKTVKNGDRYELHKSLDENKDQTYFLWGLKQNVLSRTVFPLCDTIKEKIKDGKKESMDICFIPDGDTGKFIGDRIKDGGKQGNFVDTHGNILGRHKGIYNYTVGQRRGLNIALGSRAYVIDIDPQSGDIKLGFENDMRTEKIMIGNLNFVSCEKNDLPKSGLYYKSRSRMKPEACDIIFENDTAVIIPKQNAKRVAFGQSVCIYDNERLLLGGIVKNNI